MRLALAATIFPDVRLESIDDGLEWFIPIPGWEHIAYPTKKDANNAATRRCVTYGVMPIPEAESRPRNSWKERV